MNVHGVHYRTIWVKKDDDRTVQVIDQRFLPHKFIIEDLTNVDESARAIKEMHIRGAGLVGATAGFGMYLAALSAPQDSPETFTSFMEAAGEKLKATRPTAVNLEWAVHRQLDAMAEISTVDEKVAIAFQTARDIADEDAEFCRRIGEHGKEIIRAIYERKNGEPVNILTHCNAGWLAFVDYGTATAPMYAAHDEGIPIHVWVDETRPRNQGARLTAWELGQHGVPHTIIADNVGGHLMQHGLYQAAGRRGPSRSGKARSHPGGRGPRGGDRSRHFGGEDLGPKRRGHSSAPQRGDQVRQLRQAR